MRRNFYQNHSGREHRRARGVRGGSKDRPRLSVFRSNKHIYAQLIDDKTGKTLAAASNLKDAKSVSQRQKPERKTEAALEIGRRLAKKAQKLGIKKVVFDRRGYRYHGRVKALAEGARDGGLEF